MEPWGNRIQNSPALANAQAIRDKISAIDLNALSVEDRDKFRRADLVAETIIEKLNNADPRLVNTSALSNIGGNLANVSSYLDTWAAGNPSYIASIESEMDAAVIQLAALTPDLDIPEAKEAITRMRKSVAANINRADQLIDQLKKRGSEADVAIDEKLSMARQGFDQLEQDLDKLEADIESARNANAKIITDQTTAYNQAESERSAKFAEQIALHQKQLTENLANIEKEAKNSLREIKEKAQGDQQVISDAKKEVERLLGIIGDEALVGDYSKRAKSEAKTV